VHTILGLHRTRAERTTSKTASSRTEFFTNILAKYFHPFARDPCIFGWLGCCSRRYVARERRLLRAQAPAQWAQEPGNPRKYQLCSGSLPWHGASLDGSVLFGMRYANMRNAFGRHLRKSNEIDIETAPVSYWGMTMA